MNEYNVCLPEQIVTEKKVNEQNMIPVKNNNVTFKNKLIPEYIKGVD